MTDLPNSNHKQINATRSITINTFSTINHNPYIINTITITTINILQSLQSLQLIWNTVGLVGLGFRTQRKPPTEHSLGTTATTSAT